MKFKRTILSISIAAAISTLSACGGGGGGGGNQASINNQVPVQPSSTVPYHTPSRAVTLTASVGAFAELFTADLTGSGQENIIIAGRPNSNISVMGWENGTLVDQTSRWFSPGDNLIAGTEPSVKFSDFDKDGKLDMFVAHSTDGTKGASTVFFNDNNRFIKYTLPMAGAWSHDSTVVDLNRDGYSDIIMTDYGPNMTFAISNQNRTFTTYIQDPSTAIIRGTSAVAAGDFLNNGSITLVTTDSCKTASCLQKENKLHSWSIVNSKLVFSDTGVILPTPRFALPKWASYNFGTGNATNSAPNHDIRALAYDWNNDSKEDLIIVSRPWLTNGQWPKFSEIQFIKNNGNGSFTDMTDSVVVGYNTSYHASYNPRLMDINGDGLIDIYLSSYDPHGSYENSQFLIKTSDGKFVAAYQTIITEFNKQVSGGRTNVTIVKGPNNNMYLATMSGGNVYLSLLGENVVSASQAISTIKVAWPWMSDAQANQVLAATGQTFLNGSGIIIDLDAALNPYGVLGLPVNGQLVSLQGYIGGINLNGSANQIKVVDSLGRDFNINYSSTSTLGKNMFSRFVDAIDDDTRGAQLSGMEFGRYNGFKFGGTPDNRNMAVGVTGIELAKNVSLSAQYSRMPFSPFVQLNGSWGLVKSSDTIESTVTYRNKQFVGKLGTMYSTTEIQSGLVNRINPITSMWAETGYEWANFKAYTGILPKVLSGSADITLPTGIDNQGRITYTNTQANVYSPTVTYARFSYTERVNKAVSLKLNGMVTSQQQTTVMGEVKVNF